MIIMIIKKNKEIKKDIIFCLEGFCDLEELLNQNENIHNLEYDFILAKTSLNMSEWELKKYTNKISKKSNIDKCSLQQIYPEKLSIKGGSKLSLILFL